MKNSIYLKFKNSLDNNILSCSDQELQEYLYYGLLLKTKNGYIDRDNNNIIVDVPKLKNFDINFTNIISSGLLAAQKNYEKRVYCMSNKLYNKYKDSGKIIIKDEKEYFRVFEKEEWLVNII